MLDIPPALMTQNQISMAQAFDQSMDFLSKTNTCDLAFNPNSTSNRFPCPTTEMINVDSSRWYPPPPPLPPRLLDCSPSFKHDCNATSGGDGGGGGSGESGKVTRGPGSMSVLVALVAIFTLLITSSVVGFLLKRKNRSRIAPQICCRTKRTDAASPVHGGTASSTSVRHTGMKKTSDPPDIRTEATSIVGKCAHAQPEKYAAISRGSTWDCLGRPNSSSCEENNNNNIKYYYDNRAAELTEY